MLTLNVLLRVGKCIPRLGTLVLAQSVRELCPIITLKAKIATCAGSTNLSAPCGASSEEPAPTDALLGHHLSLQEQTNIWRIRQNGRGPQRPVPANSFRSLASNYHPSCFRHLWLQFANKLCCFLKHSSLPQKICKMGNLFSGDFWLVKLVLVKHRIGVCGSLILNVRLNQQFFWFKTTIVLFTLRLSTPWIIAIIGLPKRFHWFFAVARQ